MNTYGICREKKQNSRSICQSFPQEFKFGEFYVFFSQRTAKKCSKMKNASAWYAERAKILLFVIKYANL